MACACFLGCTTHCLAAVRGMIMRDITIINCKSGDVFEMSGMELLDIYPTGNMGIHSGFGFGRYDESGVICWDKVIELTAYDPERDVFTVECK